MAQVTISAVQDVIDAFKASAAAAGFATVDLVAGSKLQIDFSADPNYVNLDNTFYIEFQNSGGRMQYRVCLQPKGTATWTDAKALTCLRYPGLGSSDYEVADWRDMGAIGDIVSYSTVGNFMAVMPNKVAQPNTDSFFLWKSNSPYDGVIRYYFSCAYAQRAGSYTYYGQTIGQVSPAVQTCNTTGSAYRTIVGDGLTTPCVIWQNVNSMTIDYMPNWVAWRSDLSLYANNFTIDGKTYHYVGYWMGSRTNGSWPTDGFQLAVRMDA